MPTMNDRIPLYLTAAVAGTFVAAMLLAQPYSWGGSEVSRYSAYATPARSFLQAALRRDSARLVDLSASPRPVAWALAFASRHPDAVGEWAREASVWTGFRKADTVEVLFHSGPAVCGEHPIWMRFVGDTGAAKVVEAGSECFGSK
jgi:hypothetical protein